MLGSHVSLRLNLTYLVGFGQSNRNVFSHPHASAAAIWIDEVDAGRF
jgi:hypothetical protein